jgi:hypothetical protein
MVVGLFAYGASLVFFVIGLRHLGKARTGAYYAVAPFIGAVLSIAFLHEPISSRLLIAGALMAVGLWLHLMEKYIHTHVHIAMDHEMSIPIPRFTRRNIPERKNGQFSRSEEGLNQRGDDLLGSGNKEEATAVLDLNASQTPK